MCLPETKDNDFSHRWATITGWGRTIPWNATWQAQPKNDYQCKLMESEVKLLEHSECQDSYPHAFDEDINSKICGFRNGTNTCKGDSGGPVVVEENGKVVLVGIVSYGVAGCDPSQPMVYAR